MALTKNDIVAKVNDLGFTKKKSIETVESLLEIIKGTLEEGDDVLVSGFGKFCVKEKQKRRGRNPATGSDLILRERKVVTFKCSGKLRNKINGEEIKVHEGSSDLGDGVREISIANSGGVLTEPLAERMLRVLRELSLVLRERYGFL